MYQRILLAAALQQWDRYSPYALAARDVAAELVRHTSKCLDVLTVYQHGGDRSSVPREPGAKYCEEEIQKWAAAAREEEARHTEGLMNRKMNDYVGPLEADGFTVSRILRVGNPRTTIVEVAQSVAADVLVIGSHSKRSLLDVVLGGTAQQIIRHAPCLVVLVSPEQGPRISRLNEGGRSVTA
jgi:nucleotide-binding universal stress UspA family protein